MQKTAQVGSCLLLMVIWPEQEDQPQTRDRFLGMDQQIRQQGFQAPGQDRPVTVKGARGPKRCQSWAPIDPYGWSNWITSTVICERRCLV